MVIGIQCNAQKIDLKKLTQKNQKVYLGVENMDSVDYFYDIASKHMKNLGRWKISQTISDADFVIILKGFNIKISGYPHFECYAKVFDNKMNFIYRGNFIYKSGSIWDTYETFMDKTIKKVIYTLPTELSRGNISKTSIYYTSRKKSRMLGNFYEITFNKNYKLAMDKIRDGQNKDAIKYLSKCIIADPSRMDLYKQRAILYIELEDGKKVMTNLKHYAKSNPLDSDIDICWQMGRYIKSERDVRVINRSLAIVSALNSFNMVLSQYNNTTPPVNAFNTAKPSSSIQLDNNERIKKETCSFCKGTGISPVAKSVASYTDGQHWCEYCKKTVSDSHGYHDQCPSCKGKGYIMKIK